MNFFEMLVLSKKLSFADGKVSFYGQDISVYPLQSVVEYTGLINKDSESVKFTYITAKNSMIEYKQNIASAYNQSDTKKWIVETVNLYGLGEIQFDTSSSQLTGGITVENSPFAQNLKGKIDRPVDHILRGIIAGITSVVSNIDYDVIELKCETTGNTNCKLVLDNKEALIQKFPNESKEQLP